MNTKNVMNIWKERYDMQESKQFEENQCVGKYITEAFVQKRQI